MGSWTEFFVWLLLKVVIGFAAGLVIGHLVTRSYLRKLSKEDQ